MNRLSAFCSSLVAVVFLETSLLTSTSGKGQKTLVLPVIHLLRLKVLLQNKPILKLMSISRSFSRDKMSPQCQIRGVERC